MRPDRPTPLRFTNHSCAPNAVLRIRQGRIEIYAMRGHRGRRRNHLQLRRNAPRRAPDLPLWCAQLRGKAVNNRWVLRGQPVGNALTRWTGLCRAGG